MPTSRKKRVNGKVVYIKKSESGEAGSGASGTKGEKQSIQQEFKAKVQAFEKAGKDKIKVSQALSELNTFLNSNIQANESGISTSDMDVKHVFNLTGDRVWYRNNAGTTFILPPNGYWLKFNKSGKVTIEGKISKKDIRRVRNLLKKS